MWETGQGDGAAGPKKTVLFYRNFRKFKGGQLKVWHYFNHVLASPRFDAMVELAPGSVMDRTNPWLDAADHVVESGALVRPDVFFVAGRDWVMLDQHPAAGDDVPVINLVQQVRHADPNNNRYRFLGRKAIRVCVSEEVTQVLRETGLTRGPLITVPIGLDLEVTPADGGAPRDADVLIAAFKQPELGEELGRRLGRPGRRVEVLSELLPRAEYLDRVRRAMATVFLPNEVEGFYLPALEGMALGTLVVCPDCVGNRSFCLPGHNAFRPDYDIEALLQATEAALALAPDRARRVRENARQTVETHSLLREREAFLRVLHNVEDLWRGGAPAV